MVSPVLYLSLSLGIPVFLTAFDTSRFKVYCLYNWMAKHVDSGLAANVDKVFVVIKTAAFKTFFNKSYV